VNNRKDHSHQNEVRFFTGKKRKEGTCCRNCRNVDLILSALYKDGLFCSLECFR